MPNAEEKRLVGMLRRAAVLAEASADVLVRTRHEVNRVRDVLGSLTHEVLHKGRKVYG